MTPVVNPARLTVSNTETRYVPAFFQHGTKVLTPVHGYGYCTAVTKPYATMTKEIYMPHLNVEDMYRVGQRVGVCVSEIAYVAVKAWGIITLDAVAVVGDQITVCGTTFTAIAGVPVGNQFDIGASASDSLTNLKNSINASAVTVTAGPVIGAAPARLFVEYDFTGTAGNQPIVDTTDPTNIWSVYGMLNGVAAGLANYWSDGTVAAVYSQLHSILVTLDNAIGIAWGGESEIDFIEHNAQTVEHSWAHLWQTVDSKSYVTALYGAITDNAGVTYYPSAMLQSRMVLCDSLDKYIPIVTANTKRYFLMDIAAHEDVAGQYSQIVAADYINYSDVAQAADSVYFDAVAPMFWDRLGHCDGTIIDVGQKKTWFKDRPFLFRICGEQIVEFDLTPITYQPATVVYISNPFGVENDILNGKKHRFVVAAPSTADGVMLPIDTNLWCHGLINTENHSFACDFRPAIDEQGMPYIKNIGNDAAIDTSGDETIAVYDSDDVVLEPFKNCTFDVFLSTPTAENDLYIGGQPSMDKFLLDIGTDPVPAAVIEGVFQYATLDGATSPIERATYPVMLSKMNVLAATAPNKFTSSVGSWQNCEYFNGQIWFISGNVLKPTNTLLEFDPVDTVEIPSAVIGLKALANQLFIMATNGIYTINTKGELEFLSSTVARMWDAVGESLYIADEKGRIFNTEFTPIPVQDQRKNTDNPYMVLAMNTSMIQDIADQWTVFDIKSAHDMLWVASSMGLWAMESSTKAWFKVSNDVFLHLVNAGSEIYGITGRVTSDQEMESIDVWTLLQNDKSCLN